MKKLFSLTLLSVILFSLAIPSQAQRRNNQYRSLSIGVKGGATLSKVNFRPSVREKYLTGITAGASVRYIEEKYFGIIGEVNFAQFGWKEDFSRQNPNTYAYSHTMNYITAAMLSHIFFGNEPIRFFINMGPQIGFYISDNYTSNFDIYDLPNFSESWETGQYLEPIKTKFDYGITAGLGLELKLKKHSIILEGRYYYGLNDFFENSKGKDANFSASAHQQISAAIAYMFHIK